MCIFICYAPRVAYELAPPSSGVTRLCSFRVSVITGGGVPAGCTPHRAARSGRCALPVFFMCRAWCVSVSQSAVMSAAYAKFHPNVVVGGTYSGQIVLWDNRSNKRTPVQRTPLSAAAHTVR